MPAAQGSANWRTRSCGRLRLRSPARLRAALGFGARLRFSTSTGKGCARFAAITLALLHLNVWDSAWFPIPENGRDTSACTRCACPSQDMLSGHRDDAEHDLSLPIVSLSLGCPGIFLLARPFPTPQQAHVPQCSTPVASAAITLPPAAGCAQGTEDPAAPPDAILLRSGDAVILVRCAACAPLANASAYSCR